LKAVWHQKIRAQVCNVVLDELRRRGTVRRIEQDVSDDELEICEQILGDACIMLHDDGLYDQSVDVE